MTTDPQRSSQQRALDDLGQLARERFDDAGTDLVHAAGKRRMRAALAESSLRVPRGLRPLHWALGVAALATLTVVIVLLQTSPSQPQALSFEVDSALAQGPYLQPPALGPDAEVRFSDGTELNLGAGGRARVATTTPHGAQLVLERGHAELHVIHKPGARWSFDAGPFTVVVTGTRFTLDWNASQEQLQVVVTEGSVLVRGAGQAEGVAVSGGQRLIASAGDSRFELAPLDAPPQTAPEIVEPPATPSAAPEAPPAASESAAAGSSASWSERVAAGDFAGVLAQARARGLDDVLARGSIADLAALADAARYRGDSALAERALQAQRSRFAGSSQARAAAFLLGRIAEDQRHDAVSALSWYDRYLKESPQGAFAAEALGRRLVLLERTAGAAAARSSAERYLQRFPDGPYARVAQQIVASP